MIKSYQGIFGYFRGASINFIYGGLSDITGWWLRYAMFSAVYQYDFPNHQSWNDRLNTITVFSLSNAILEMLLYPLARWRTIVYTGFSKQILLTEQFWKTYQLDKGNRHILGQGFWGLTVFAQSMVFGSLMWAFEDLGALGQINAGVASALISGAIFYPAVSLVRRVQADSLAKSDRYRYISVRDALDKIRIQEGYRGLYKGLGLYLVSGGLVTNLAALGFYGLSRENRIME